MVPAADQPYPRDVDAIPPLDQVPPATAEPEPELTEVEAAEIEAQLRALGYIE